MNNDFDPPNYTKRKVSQYSKHSKASFAIPESVNNMLGSINLTAQTDPKRLQAIDKYKKSKQSQGTINLTSQTEPNRFQPIDAFTINKPHASMHAPEHGEKKLENIMDIEESSKDNSFLNMQEPLLKEKKQVSVLFYLSINFD